MEHPLTRLARDITDKYFPCHMQIGKVIKHPKGYNVKVISGCFRDPTYGRISNWWTWQRVYKSGKLGPEQSGYGW